jgi:hypothetical protein
MAQQPPAVHPKNAPTGKGVQPKTPGNASMGNSMHRPVTGYTDQQQQTQERE